MGSNKLVATYTTPAAAAAAAVCCMCGDHGLLPELFRCTACSVRSQHTYCTDQYPKAESYGTCNWCLRADGVSPAKSSVKEPVLNHHHRRPILTHSNQLIGGGGNAVSAGPALKTARGDFVSHQSKPIKKQRLLRRSASDLGTRVRAHEAPPSPGIGRGRPRVRRYKLLEEVITS